MLQEAARIQEADRIVAFVSPFSTQRFVANGSPATKKLERILPATGARRSCSLVTRLVNSREAFQRSNRVPTPNSMSHDAVDVAVDPSRRVDTPHRFPKLSTFPRIPLIVLTICLTETCAPDRTRLTGVRDRQQGRQDSNDASE
jgi:hypothetical protein